MYLFLSAMMIQLSPPGARSPGLSATGEATCRHGWKSCKHPEEFNDVPLLRALRALATSSICTCSSGSTPTAWPLVKSSGIGLFLAPLPPPSSLRAPKLPLPSGAVCENCALLVLRELVGECERELKPSGE